MGLMRTMWPSHMYYDFMTQNMQSTGALLGFILRQLIEAFARIPDEVQRAFKGAKTQAGGSGLRLPEIVL